MLLGGLGGRRWSTDAATECLGVTGSDLPMVTQDRLVSSHEHFWRLLNFNPSPRTTASQDIARPGSDPSLRFQDTLAPNPAHVV